MIKVIEFSLYVTERFIGDKQNKSFNPENTVYDAKRLIEENSLMKIKKI